MISLTTNGLGTNTFEEILAEMVADFRAEFGSSVAVKLSSSMGQLQRMWSFRETQLQEKMLQLYQMLDPRLAEGVHADQRFSLLGTTRLPATFAEVLGTATGTPATSIPNGTRVSVGGKVFEIADGPYTIGGGGTVSSVRVVSQVAEETDVSALGAWTIVDAVSGFTSFDDDSQPVAGRALELDSEFRSRAEVERFSRAAGPLDAIEALVSKVTGVTYVKAWENVTTDPTDADGIPYLAINVVVEGGDDTEVATAIRDSMPAGHATHGATSVLLSAGVDTRTINFDRVTEIDIYIDVDFITSTSEESEPADLEQTAKDALMDYAMGPVDASTGLRSSLTAAWQIGTDVLPVRLVGALAAISGHDGITVTTSDDDVVYTGTKLAISLRERAVLAAARITVTES